MTQDRYARPRTAPFGDVRLDLPPATPLGGIPAYVISSGSDGVNRLSLYVRGGVVNEPMPWLAALTGLTALEGSDTLTAEQVAQTLDFNGAWKQVQTADEWTEVTLYSLNANHRVSLDVLCSCLSHPAFRAADLELLQRRYAAAFAAAAVQPRVRALVALRQLYYGHDHPLAHADMPADVMDVTTAQMAEFYRQHYRKANMRLVLAGEITDDVLSLTGDALAALDLPGPPDVPYDWTALTLPATPTPEQRTVDCPGAAQAAINIAIPAVPRRHPDYFPLRILAYALGGYLGSRLMANIREQKGYTYGIRAYLSGREHDGHLGITTECDHAYVWPLLDEVRREIERIASEPMPDGELDVVRNQMLGELVKTLDTPLSVGAYVASIITCGMHEQYFNDQVRAIQTITPADLLLVAGTYLRADRMLTAVAGDCNRL